MKLFKRNKKRISLIERLNQIRIEETESESKILLDYIIEKGMN